MPIITIHGIPKRLHHEPSMEKLVKTLLPLAASSVPRMGITPDKVTVYILDDVTGLHDGQELVVFVEGLFMREERTPEVRQRFAEAIRDAMIAYVESIMPNCQMIEVIPRSQRSDDGFADWRRPPE